jgi:hypothetical protein
MPVHYDGAAPYRYSNSLSICLAAAGCDEPGLCEPGFLESLTTMPFGKQYLRSASGSIGMFVPNGSDPDTGLTRALDALGWDCDDTIGGDAASALERLRRAVASGPALLGPVEIGYLGYDRAASSSPIGDRFMVAIGMEDDTLLVHDPAGYPCGIISWEQFCSAWRAEGIAYRRGPYTLRHEFRRVSALCRRAMVARTIPLARQNAIRRSDQGALRGAEALRCLAEDLCGKVSERVRGHLVWFALPLAARRCLDGARFLGEAYLPELAGNFECQARLFERMQSDAVARRWSAVAGAMMRLGDLEEQFVERIRAL